MFYRFYLRKAVTSLCKAVIFLLCLCKSYGQNPGVEVHYSNKFYDLGFYKQLPQTKRIAPGQPPHGITTNFIRSYFFGMSSVQLVFSGTYMLPAAVTFNDSIHGKISAFHVGIPLLGRDLLRSTKIDFIVVAGLNGGGLKISANRNIRMRNPFVAPKLLVMPRVAIGRLILSCMAEYSIDISSRKWRQSFWKPGNTYDFDPFGQTGLHLSAGIGYWFNKK